MQTLNTVQLQDNLLLESDMENVTPVVDSLAVASYNNLGERYFLKTVYRIEVRVTINDVSTCIYHENLMPGRIYKCVSYVYTDPSTGDKSTQYKWKSVSFAENGALNACQLVTPIIKTEGASGEGTTVRILWTDPADKSNLVDEKGNLDPSLNAIWAYTAVVRKPGTSKPTSIYDGEIVGYSSVRNQYSTGTGFPDLEPEGVEYSYNLFAVTRYGIATGLEGSEEEDIDWDGIKEAIRAGKAGSIFGLGDIITVHHNIFGDLQMQVVGIDNATIDNTVSGQEGLTHSVTFMSERIILRAAYDVPEEEVYHDPLYGDQANPGDHSSVREESYVSKCGRATWLMSNLRQWLNSDDSYTRTTDTVYNTKKCYFTRNDSTGVYTLLSDPVDPSTVNPSEQVPYWYESAWNYTKPYPSTVPSGVVNNWDNKPDGFKVGADAAYVYNNKEIPGFLAGLTHGTADKPGVTTAIATVLNKTVTDPYIYSHTGGSQVNYLTSSDKIFIPSYRELLGNEPLGARISGAEEGTQFPFFDASKTIPGLSETRSLHKLDLEGNLSGYYTRTVGTVAHAGTENWYIDTASKVWTVSVGNYTSKQPLDKAVTEAKKCSLSAAEAIARTSKDQLAAPGIAFCFVIA